MADPTYTPPEVWSVDTESGGRFANINRPTAGAREEKDLPSGEHDFQLYSLATPNGVKATVMFEELLEAGHSGAEYDAYTINIGDGVQFTSGFVDVNPNSKIPALLDRSGDEPVRIFESGAILMHLAEKFGAFLPTDHTRPEVLSWLFWQIGSAPFIGGGFGHFYAYAPEKYEYPINRYAMETKRLFDVADQRLAKSEYLGGKDYTIADIAAWPWMAPFVEGTIYNEAKKFLSIDEYENVARWAKQIAARPAVKRGRIVNKAWGDEDTQLLERHSAADFEGKKL
ncbi:glutathione-dependent disulfide-bond oxidoreductase [Qipengyuania sp. 1NDW9]|uniref:glutathione-dependent disulfide-bond oxidoreductase n=1 Tax=Qipengyuania TaxID=1855416 RepID=UPI001C879762|nr:MULTISPECIES: glutathione-dependent disulfide-bond oxidoreductase [Qipengyuania]MBX7492784.1 glutathione-dependent disulfide-bond oxidoreductase [Qipengyuania xiapuensis]UOR15167.1 glutathione-dependent disulfide-bond oxidoreductase [Qipengyuania aquimaris]